LVTVVLGLETLRGAPLMYTPCSLRLPLLLLRVLLLLRILLLSITLLRITLLSIILV